MIACEIWKIKIGLTHCGLVTLYGDINLGQHWLREWLVAWWHQAITWTNVHLSSIRSSAIHLTAILQEIPQPSGTELSLIITYLKFCSNLPGANESTISIVSADGLAPSGAKASAGTVMTKFGSHRCMGLALKMVKNLFCGILSPMEKLTNKA